MKYWAPLANLLYWIAARKTYDGSDAYYPSANVEKDDQLHEKNSLEWWYFAGHLKEIDGDRTFGIEYVFFHTNPFGNKDYTLMNFALTDPSTQSFYYDTEARRKNDKMLPQNPIALDSPNNGSSCTLSGINGEYELAAEMKDHPISMQLSTQVKKQVLMHGDGGYKEYKNLTKAGYFSFTRLHTQGIINYKGQQIPVSGTLWYDRQWNCGRVLNQKICWDWMFIQLENGDDLMVYQITSPLIPNYKCCGGTYYTKDQVQYNLSSEQVKLKPTRFWRSEQTTISYPIDWKLELPDFDLDLEVQALVDDQELKFMVGLYQMKYWEGMCKAKGRLKGVPITGESYLEITNRQLANRFDLAPLTPQ